MKYKKMATILKCFLLKWLLVNLTQASVLERPGRNTFTAAVYEHAVRLPTLKASPLTRSEAVTEMMPNLRVYSEKTTKASAKYIPDISSTWNPCQEPNRYTDVDVQVFLSCMAKNNSIYVVANFGDKQPCDKEIDSFCPSDGRYQFNTDVVYDPTGTFVAKYHKRHLFFEFQFDTPSPYDIVTFDTPFGRFGLFTCFDILFEHPAVDLIQKHNVSNIALPTAWIDAGPFLTSIQFHSSFAMLHGVNFLAANIHRPEGGYHGSGIYTSEGAIAYYYNTRVSSEGKLIVKTIPISNRHNVISMSDRVVEVPVAQTNQEHFAVEMFHDKHNIVPLTNPLREATVCHNDLCCNVSYSGLTSSKRQMSLNSNQALPNEYEFFALVAYSSIHTGATYNLEICSLVRCNVVNGQPECGDMSATMNGEILHEMNSFVLYGNFSTPYVYPQILLGGDGNLALTSYPKQWSYSNKYLTSHAPLRQPLGTASLFGRAYQRDRFS